MILYFFLCLFSPGLCAVFLPTRILRVKRYDNFGIVSLHVLPTHPSSVSLPTEAPPNAPSFLTLRSVGPCSSPFFARVCFQGLSTGLRVHAEATPQFFFLSFQFVHLLFVCEDPYSLRPHRFPPCHFPGSTFYFFGYTFARSIFFSPLPFDSAFFHTRFHRAFSI